jgi:hypothetical protein
VSFSYARADVGLTLTPRAYAFIFKALSAPTGHPVTLRCAYPFNSGTANSTDPCTFRGVCEEQGVTSVAAWRSKYGTKPHEGCAFTSSADQFQLSIAVRSGQVVPEKNWNEIMIAAWPQDIPEALPLEALLYKPTSGLGPAQFIQRDYFRQTGRFLPIVSLNVHAADKKVFNYSPDDQLGEGSPSGRQITALPVER